MRQLFLHAGLPKTGTTYLHELVLANRGRLAAAGLGLGPFLDTGSHYPRLVPALVERLGLADPESFLALPDPDAPWTPPAPVTAREIAAVRRACLVACVRRRNPVAGLAAAVARRLRPLTAASASAA